MSHFEYVSVAVALIYALTVGRLLTVVSSAFDRRSRYWVHSGWVVTLLLVCVLQWWMLWNASQVAWTPVRFLYVLALPALLFVRAGALVGESSDGPISFHERFYEMRIRFFSLGVVTAGMGFFSPWMLGIVPWFAPTPIHTTALVLMALSVVGVVSKNATVHAVLVVVAFVLASSSFFIVRVAVPGA